MLLVFFLVLGIVIFASLVYYAERIQVRWFFVDNSNLLTFRLQMFAADKRLERPKLQKVLICFLYWMIVSWRT
jgi:hypothetical protein